MGTFQPLYYPGGRYSAHVDRKLLTALMSVNTSGVPLQGVLPSGTTANAMFVTYGGPNKLYVSTGYCLIPDSTSPSSTTGLYLAGVEGSAELVEFSSAGGSSRTDKIYAIVDETEYIITHKALDSATSVATITTSTDHGFKTGYVVVVSGIDDLFDGVYRITSVTTNTFSYERSGPDIPKTYVGAQVIYGASIQNVMTKALASSGQVSLTTQGTHGLTTAAQGVTVRGVDPVLDGLYPLQAATGSFLQYVVNKPVTSYSPVSVSTSSIARAKVPFYLAVDEGSAGTYSSKTKILLAETTVSANSGVATVVDKRTFTTTNGGVHLYATSANPAVAFPGRFAYNVGANSLQYYTNQWNNFLTIGTTSSTAAAGNHGHDFAPVSHDTIHDAAYAPATHTHNVPDDITDWPADPGEVSSGIAYVDPVTNGASAGTNTSFLLDLTSAEYVSLNVQTNYTTPANNGMFVMVEWSVYLGAISAAAGLVDVSVQITGGGNTISPEPEGSGGATHEINATDGTAFGRGNVATRRGSNGYGHAFGSRLVQLEANTTYTFTMYGKVSTGTASYGDPVLRVYPVQVIY